MDDGEDGKQAGDPGLSVADDSGDSRHRVLSVGLVVECEGRKRSTNREEKAKLSDDTIRFYYQGIQESTPIQ